ncbi:hypothetical protein ANN_14131 [Periplaneta americana]|uniref:Uncharacterized protein n=1 Tax=Periplaneta americana TaxID=6978 RepID=A0ABQ8SVI2_PERAM|nr:hypothetical protein ANN_14131 [Periplaneta americana]
MGTITTAQPLQSTNAPETGPSTVNNHNSNQVMIKRRREEGASSVFGQQENKHILALVDRQAREHKQIVAEELRSAMQEEATDLRTLYSGPAEPSPSARHSNVKTPKFDGTTSWAIFRRQFEAIAEHNGWTPAEKTTQLLAALQGQASEILHSVPEDGTATEIMAVFEGRYGDHQLEAAFRTQLKKRVQQSGKSLQEFAMAVELAHKALSGLPTNFVVGEAAYTFGSGVRNSEIRQQLRRFLRGRQQRRDTSGRSVPAIHLYHKHLCRLLCSTWTDDAGDTGDHIQNYFTMISKEKRRNLILLYSSVLTYLVTGMQFKQLAYSFRISKTAVSTMIIDICKSIWLNLHPIYMPVPTQKTLKKNGEEFEHRTINAALAAALRMEAAKLTANVLASHRIRSVAAADVEERQPKPPKRQRRGTPSCWSCGRPGHLRD